MHHALLVSEIFQEICAWADHSSLPAVARTCRAFHDLALDELWRDLYSIYPFIHLLAETMPGENQQIFVECLTSQQWETLRRYSARTRTLYMCMVDDLTRFDRFPCFSNPPDFESFFPNLRTLAWYPDNHLAMLPFFRLLCGPTLTSLSAEFAADTASLAMVAALGVLCPNITDISISSSSETVSDELANALSTSICRWKDLTHVTCDDLSTSAFEYLSQVKNLQSLTACATAHLSSFSQALGVQKSSFPRLQSLHLYTGILSTTTACLSGLRLALEEFRLDLFDAGEVSSDSSCLQDLFTALVEACSQSYLARFYLCVIHPHFPSSSAVATIRDIRPLLHFRRLRIVRLEGLSTFTFNDNDIAELANAWPDIEELALSTCVDYPAASLPSLQSLVRLARSCSKLRALSLVVDTTKEFIPTVRAIVRGVRSNVLSDLCLGNSPVGSPIAVAHLLHALYPALKQVDLSVWNREPLNCLPGRDRYETCWGMVNIELQTLRGKTRDATLASADLNRVTARSDEYFIQAPHLSIEAEIVSGSEIDKTLTLVLNPPPVTFVHLTRTCRAFKEPVLDALWKVISELDHCRPLRPSVYRPCYPSAKSHAATSTQVPHSLSPEQWRSMQKYTSRITVIHKCCYFHPSFKMLYATVLRLPPFPEPMFPKLKAILGASSTPRHVAFYRWLNGPSLTQLDIILSRDPTSRPPVDSVSPMNMLYADMECNIYLNKDPVGGGI